MIALLNLVIEDVERRLAADPAADIELAALAARSGTTEHHLRRMFASLAGLPLSEYVRRRRMSLAAADLVSGTDGLLTVAVRHGYGSTEAFGRAFRGVHGVGPGDLRQRHPGVGRVAPSAAGGDDQAEGDRADGERGKGEEATGATHDS